jgi:putative ABC transport system substrate-binding protein
MRRREVLGILGVGTLGWHTRVYAQSRRKRIAIVVPSLPVEQMASQPYYRRFVDELGRLGFVEGDTVVMDRYSGQGQSSLYADLARRVLETTPDAVFTVGGTLALDFKAVTQDIPIVALVADPLALGITTSLSAPGGNVTGVTADGGRELYGKRLAILAEATPISRVGYLSSASNWGRSSGDFVREAARRLNIQLVHLELNATINMAAYADALKSVDRSRLDALLVSDEPEHNSNSKVLVDLITNTRLPAMYPFRDLALAGGLMAYAVDFLEVYGHAAAQVAKILSGVRPAEIPFYQPTRFQLIINAKAAQRIGLQLPPVLLASADEVIE